MVFTLNDPGPLYIPQCHRKQKTVQNDECSIVLACKIGIRLHNFPYKIHVSIKCCTESTYSRNMIQSVISKCGLNEGLLDLARDPARDPARRWSQGVCFC